MRANRRVDTGPERALRSELHRLGLRFRKDLRLKLEASVRPDIVFTRAKVAVFVDGCFWHRCPEHGQMPKSNRGYWQSKLARNVERDGEADLALREAGWTVFRFSSTCLRLRRHKRWRPASVGEPARSTRPRRPRSDRRAYSVRSPRSTSSIR